MRRAGAGGESHWAAAERRLDSQARKGNSHPYGLEGEAELRDVVDRLIARLENQAGAASQPFAGR